MPATLEDLEKFRIFAAAQMPDGASDLELAELILVWDRQRERDLANAAIRQGLVEIDAGLTRPIREVLNELRKEFGIDE